MTGADDAAPLEGWARYAVYYTPPPGPLARLGAAWLGDGAGVEALATPRPRAALIARAARYGFHATLKAPFRLAPGATGAALDAAVAALAARLAPARAAGLRVAAFHGFVALRPEGDAAALDAVAAACARDLDGFRAALTDADRARYRDLTPAQARALDAVGYPHALDAFAFHMTLTCAQPSAEAEATRAALAAAFAPALPRPFTLDALTLCGDPGAGRPFVALRRHPLRGG